MRKNILILMLLAMVMTGLLSGCLFKSVDELYALPKQSEEYYDLQAEIDKLMVSGVSYAAPTSGSNQQSVQLADLDGDNEDEAIVFLKYSGEKPLKAYLFDRVNDSFENIAVIEGDGSNFESVEYIQFDGEPGLELVIGRQVSEQVLQSLGVYSLEEGQLVEKLTDNYSEYKVADLDMDGNSDIFLLRFNAEERTGVAEYYRYLDNQLQKEPEVQLSTGVASVKRIILGDVSYNNPAIFVAGLCDETTIITDVFLLEKDDLVNLSTSGATATSANAIQNYFSYATDIDNDDIIELPQPSLLPQYNPDETTEEQWILNWYSIYPVAYPLIKTTTYHNNASGWYLELPSAWDGKLTVTRTDGTSGVRGYVFSQWNGSQDSVPQEILTIYPYSGIDRNEQATADGKFILSEKGEITYGAQLGTAPLARALDEETVKEMFHFVHVDWNSGET